MRIRCGSDLGVVTTSAARLIIPHKQTGEERTQNGASVSDPQLSPSIAPYTTGEVVPIAVVALAP